MAGHVCCLWAVRAGSRTASASGPYSATSRALRDAAVETNGGSRNHNRPRGRPPQKDGSGMNPRYKPTEAGVIPVDWDVVAFGDMINYTKGFPFKSGAYQSDGIRVIRVSDTTFDSIKENNPIF